ncbi:MAG: DJ-1 family glyoxalase III [Campylobacteraceae bacterium]
MIVLPGGLPGAEHLAKSEKLKKIIQKMDKAKKYVTAICAAPWALSEAGVLKDKYTCYPSFEKVVNHAGYTPNEDVVVDKNVITSRGPATAFVFALELAKKLKGDETYKELKKELLCK